MGKRKQILIKEKSRERKEFVVKHDNIFDMYFEDDIDYGNQAVFDKYNLDPHKSFNIEEATISRRNEMIKSVSDY